MKHPKQVKGFESKAKNPLKHLAKNVGNLHYESLTTFLVELANKIETDGFADIKRGRPKLGNHLLSAALGLINASSDIDEAWRISKPFMPEGEFGWRGIPWKEQIPLKVHWVEQGVFITKEKKNGTTKEVLSEPYFLLMCKKDTLDVVLLDCKTNTEHIISSGAKSEGYRLANNIMSE